MATVIVSILCGILAELILVAVQLSQLIAVQKKQTDVLNIVQAHLCTLIEISRQEKSDE